MTNRAETPSRDPDFIVMSRENGEDYELAFYVDEGAQYNSYVDYSFYIRVTKSGELLWREFSSEDWAPYWDTVKVKVNNTYHSWLIDNFLLEDSNG